MGSAVPLGMGVTPRTPPSPSQEGYMADPLASTLTWSGTIGMAVHRDPILALVGTVGMADPLASTLTHPIHLYDEITAR